MKTLYASISNSLNLRFSLYLPFIWPYGSVQIEASRILTQ
jgi:hypothetical protein